MKGCAVLFLALILTMTNEPNSPIAHVRNRFEFVVQAPLHRAAPLFGPEGERCWAGPQWNPEFLYPQPGRDVEGAVFTVQRGSHPSVWVSTLFDLAEGRMQYVSFLVGRVVSTVDVRLTPLDSSSTRAEVTYARTALDAAANEDVRAMGVSDRESGPHWQEAIARCLVGR
jgi:hypothetical protein